MIISQNVHLQKMIEDLKRRGGYATVDDLLIAALNALAQQFQSGGIDAKHLDRLLTVGNSQIERGEVIDGREAQIARRKARKMYTEAELLAGVNPNQVGGDIDWGGPVGKEVL